MREILFRGKRADNGEWVEGYLFSTLNHIYIAYTGQYDDDLFVSPKNIFIAVLPETVGQYTGLSDKNDVKIFEGDILSAHLDEYDPDYETVTQIIWEDCGWRMIEDNGLSDPLDEADAEVFAIIGNIHDNPELLEGGEE